MLDQESIALSGICLSVFLMLSVLKGDRIKQRGDGTDDIPVRR